MPEEDLELEENLEIENEEVPAEEGLNNEDESPELIEKAKRLGFKTDDEYKGNPKYKLTAKEYLDRAEKGGTIKKLESDISEMRTAFEKMQKFTQMQIQSAKERAIEELRQKQIKAVDEDGTSASVAFDAYEKEKEKVERQYNPEPEPVVRNNVAPPEITRFYQENAWYKEDIIMRGAANALHREVVEENPGMPLDEQLKLVKRKITENFPERFESPKKRTQSIEGGGNVHGGEVRKKATFQSIGFSASDISDANKLIKSGEFKDEAEFVKSYVSLNKGRK